MTIFQSPQGPGERSLEGSRCGRYSMVPIAEALSWDDVKRVRDATRLSCPQGIVTPKDAALAGPARHRANHVSIMAAMRMPAAGATIECLPDGRGKRCRKIPILIDSVFEAARFFQRWRSALTAVWNRRPHIWGLSSF